MAFPTFVAAGTLVETTTTVTINPNASHATGDYELCITETQNETVSLTTPAGFTAHPGSPVQCASGTATVATRLTVFERIWNGSDGSPITNDPGNHVIATILSFRRSSGTWATLADARSATSGTGWTATPETASENTSLEWTGITTDTADQLIIHLVAQSKPDIAGGTAEMSAHTNAALASITERFDDAAASGNGGWLGCFTGTLATQGATGNSTATGATASFHANLMIGIRDSAPAATVLPPKPIIVQFAVQRANRY